MPYIAPMYGGVESFRPALELGPLRKAVRADVLDLDAHWSGLLDAAVAVRNQLAHGEAARDDLLRKLHQYWTVGGFR